MAIPTNKDWKATGMGAALIAATLAFCLAYAGLCDGPSLSLRELESGHSTLMSCARDEGPLSSAELLWCSDSDSPLCSPALPLSGHIELSDAPPIAQTSVVPWIAEARPLGELPGWSRPQSQSLPPQGSATRHERPPRT